MNIARMIDHTLLRPDATRAEIVAVCREARQFEFASVCTNSFWSPLVASELAGAQSALQVGAREIDMVLNIGALKGGEDSTVESDIRAVVQACHRADALVK